MLVISHLHYPTTTPSSSSFILNLQLKKPHPSRQSHHNHTHHDTITYDSVSIGAVKRVGFRQRERFLDELKGLDLEDEGVDVDQDEGVDEEESMKVFRFDEDEVEVEVEVEDEVEDIDVDEGEGEGDEDEVVLVGVFFRYRCWNMNEGEDGGWVK
ncbi:hypothetical protein QVD17_12455 [Tagetes erecta]|uniref:Uncharacterized protein n=1 Tax=Tagetes erecta TaxID=13708 RepID=A0AAD8L287_TARER|nr:hypothetical protein QVD17_12455 [Tagetes erecta]